MAGNNTLRNTGAWDMFASVSANQLSVNHESTVNEYNYFLKLTVFHLLLINYFSYNINNYEIKENIFIYL